MCCRGLDITCAKQRCNQKDMKTLGIQARLASIKSFYPQAVKNFSQYGIE
jgi:hypothetical protein